VSVTRASTKQDYTVPVENGHEAMAAAER
jgi:hypothetical protein